MKGGLLLFLLSAVIGAGPVCAALPDSADAAAVASFFASTVTLSSASVAVHDIDGPDPRSRALAYALRAELFNLGVAVLRPDGAPDYDLRGALVADEPRTVWASALWRRSDSRLMAVYDRVLAAEAQEPSPPPVQVPQTPLGRTSARNWRVIGGLHLRGSYVGWLAGILLSCPNGRWEGGLDLGEFGAKADRLVPGQRTRYQIDVWHARLRANALLPVSRAQFLEGWLPKRTVLRAGLGLAALQVNTKVFVLGIPPNDIEQGRSQTTYLRPMVELGARYAPSRRFAFDVGFEWLPVLNRPDEARLAGHGISARLVF